jgi:hypothetical protein
MMDSVVGDALTKIVYQNEIIVPEPTKEMKQHEIAVTEPTKGAYVELVDEKVDDNHLYPHFTLSNSPYQNDAVVPKLTDNVNMDVVEDIVRHFPPRMMSHEPDALGRRPSQPPRRRTRRRQSQIKRYTICHHAILQITYVGLQASRHKRRAVFEPITGKENVDPQTSKSLKRAGVLTRRSMSTANSTPEGLGQPWYPY